MVNYPRPEDKQDADAVLENIRKVTDPGSDAIAVEADLSTLDGPQHLVQEVVRINNKKIDILVNNAGLALMQTLSDIKIDQWDAQVNLNARGMLLLTQAVVPYLAGNARIVNLSSSGARDGYAGSSIYNGTKSMMESFTRCWAM